MVTHYYPFDHDKTFTKRKMACGIWLPFDSNEIDLENPTCEECIEGLLLDKGDKKNWDEDDIPF